MNILPLVFIFISMLMLTSSLLFQKPIMLGKIKQTNCAYWRGERKWRNLYTQKLYQEAHHAVKKKKSETKRKIKDYSYPRDGIKENGKLCLAWLFETTSSPEQQQLLRKITCSFLAEVYGKAPFYQEAKKKWDDLENKIVDFFVEQSKKHPEATTLSELAQEDSALSSVLFHLFQGTNRFNLPLGLGYPPLETIISMDRMHNKKPIAFIFATQPLLNALVGKELAANIISLEKTQWEMTGKNKLLSPDELKKAVSSSPLLTWEELQLVCSFTKKSGKNRVLSTKEKKGEMVIRRNRSGIVKE